MKSFTLNFKGYWRESNKDYIPEVSGIYLVYRCVFNPIPRTVSLRELIYIGKSNNVKRRVSEHVTNHDFLETVRPGEEICYSVAEVSVFDLCLVENALIFAQKPRLNSQGKDVYVYQDSSFDVVGRCALLKYTSFSVTNP